MDDKALYDIYLKAYLHQPAHGGVKSGGRSKHKAGLRAVYDAAQRPEALKPAWTPCAERLPTALSDRSVLCAGRDPDGNWWREIVSSEWLRESAPPGFATHWMPLPDVPSSGPEGA